MNKIRSIIVVAIGLVVALGWALQPQRYSPGGGSIDQQQMQCPANSRLDGKLCACPAGKRWDGASCVQAAPGNPG